MGNLGLLGGYQCHIGYFDPDPIQPRTRQIATTVYITLLLSLFDNLLRRGTNANVVAFVLDCRRTDGFSGYYYWSHTESTYRCVGIMAQVSITNGRIQAKQSRRNNWDIRTRGLRMVEQAFPDGISKESRYERSLSFGQQHVRGAFGRTIAQHNRRIKIPRQALRTDYGCSEKPGRSICHTHYPKGSYDLFLF